MVSADRPGRSSKTPSDSAWIDVSVPIRSGMVHWPDDPEVEVERVADMAEGYGWNLTQICMSAHTGTHVDAPLHVVADGLTIDQLPLDAMIGPARVIEITSRHAVEPEELRGQEISTGERILFKTINSQRGWTSSRFLEDYVGVSPAAAEFLAARGVQTVGIDYLSIGRYGPEGEATHRILLGAGIWVIEGLDLSPVAAGAYDLVCLPLKLVGAEGAPARAILRKATA
jgi:arylformamidase